LTAFARVAVPTDRFAMVRMGKDFLRESTLPLPEDPGYMSRTVSLYMELPNCLALVLDVDGAVKGMLLAAVDDSPLAPVKMAKETVWWVDPGARGHGGRMLDCFEEWAKDRGASLVAMSALDRRVGVLYKRRFYKEADTSYYKVL